MQLDDSMVKWLANGERGISSETIFTHITGVNALRRPWTASHPLDPDDFTRCVRLLEACPAISMRFTEMASASPVWARLVEHWDELVSMLDEEVPGWRQSLRGSAPKTYERMKQLGC